MHSSTYECCLPNYIFASLLKNFGVQEGTGGGTRARAQWAEVALPDMLAVSGMHWHDGCSCRSKRQKEVAACAKLHSKRSAWSTREHRDMKRELKRLQIANGTIIKWRYVRLETIHTIISPPQWVYRQPHKAINTTAASLCTA